MEQMSNFQSISSFSEDVYKIDKMKNIFATTYLMKGILLLVIILNEKGYNTKITKLFCYTQCLEKCGTNFENGFLTSKYIAYITSYEAMPLKRLFSNYLHFSIVLV